MTGYLFLWAALLLVVVEVALRLEARVLADRSTGGGAGGGQTILCVGDSFTFGIKVKDDEKYPAILERLLNGRSGEACAPEGGAAGPADLRRGAAARDSHTRTEYYHYIFGNRPIGDDDGIIAETALATLWHAGLVASDAARASAASAPARQAPASAALSSRPSR